MIKVKFKIFQKSDIDTISKVHVLELYCSMIVHHSSGGGDVNSDICYGYLTWIIPIRG